MKKLGILLLAFTFWMGVNAETKKSIEASSTPKTEVSNDSVQKLHQNENLDPKEAVLLQKLTPNQIMELEKQRMENEKMNEMPFSKFGLLLICIAPFIFVIFIVYFTTLYKNKESLRKHELYMKALEAGQTIPENYFKEPEKPKTSNLQRGVILFMLGIGFAVIYLGINHFAGFAIVGVILGFMGGAYLLVNFLEKPKNQLPGENE